MLPWQSLPVKKTQSTTFLLEPIKQKPALRCCLTEMKNSCLIPRENADNYKSIFPNVTNICKAPTRCHALYVNTGMALPWGPGKRVFSTTAHCHCTGDAVSLLPRSQGAPGCGPSLRQEGHFTHQHSWRREGSLPFPRLTGGRCTNRGASRIRGAPKVRRQRGFCGRKMEKK